MYIYLSHACPIFPLLWPCGKIDITCSGVKKTHIKWKKPISNHITPFIVGLLLVYCWRTAGPVLSVLLMTSVLCWPAHDLFQNAWPIQDGGSSVGSPASPRRGVIKVVIHRNFTSFPTAEDSGWGDEQAKLLSRHLRIHMRLQMLFNVWQSAHTRATHG